MFDRLPAFYREEPGVLAQLCQVADDLLSDHREGLRRVEERILRSAEDGAWFGSAMRLRGGGPGRFGLASALRRWLREKHGSEPRIWTGLAVVPRDGAWLEFRAASTPSAVVAWEAGADPERGQLPDPPSGFGIPEDLLPIVTSVQAVLLRRIPARRPMAGERAQGRVFWLVSRSLVHGAVYGGLTT